MEKDSWQVAADSRQNVTRNLELGTRQRSEDGFRGQRTEKWIIVGAAFSRDFAL